MRVGTHDFPDPAMPKTVPYGVYGVRANTGWVSVGSDGDTAAFAVETLPRWWFGVEKPANPKSNRLLVCAHAGGSNGYRLRLWKRELALLATETDLAITVSLPARNLQMEPCRAPPVCSHHDELAGTTADEPRSGDRANRCNSHTSWPHRACRG